MANYDDIFLNAGYQSFVDNDSEMGSSGVHPTGGGAINGSVFSKTLFCKLAITRTTSQLAEK